MAVVGDGSSETFPDTKLIVWDDYSKKPIGEIRFKSRILNIFMRKDSLIIVTRNNVYLYEISKLKNVDKIATVENDAGIASVSFQEDRFILTTLDSTACSMNIIRYAQALLNGA